MLIHASLSTQQLHLLIQVDVEDTGLAVAQHIADHVERISLEVGSLLGKPSYPHLFCLLANDTGVCKGCQGFLFGEYRLGDICGRLPPTEILVDDGDGLIHIEITSHTDGYIIGHVPLLEIVLDIRDRGVLQVLLRTDGGLRTVGMGGCKFLAQGFPHLVTIVRQIDVILLIDSLQFRMESTDHHMLETVALDLRPVLNLIAGDVLRVTGHIV